MRLYFFSIIVEILKRIIENRDMKMLLLLHITELPHLKFQEFIETRKIYLTKIMLTNQFI